MPARGKGVFLYAPPILTHHWEDARYRWASLSLKLYPCFNAPVYHLATRVPSTPMDWSADLTLGSSRVSAVQPLPYPYVPLSVIGEPEDLYCTSRIYIRISAIGF
jgi:hypothetical protein